MEIKLDIMRRLSLSDRKAYASAFPELESAYLEDVNEAVAEAWRNFQVVVRGSLLALRITLGMRAWTIWRYSGPCLKYKGLYDFCDLAAVSRAPNTHLDFESLSAYFRPVVVEAVVTSRPLRIMDSYYRLPWTSSCRF